MRNSMALKQSLSIFSSTNPVFTLKQISLTPTFYFILDDRMLFPVANDFKEVFRDDKVVKTKREQKPFFQLKFLLLRHQMWTYPTILTLMENLNLMTRLCWMK